MLHLTPEQCRLLRELQQLEASKKLALRFNNPGEDQENIRAAIYHDGGVLMLEYLLNYDENLLEQQEKETREKEDSGDSSQSNFQF